MGNWEKRPHGYATKYEGERKNLSNYFYGKSFVGNNVEEKFMALFKKDYIYTIENYKRDKKEARTRKAKGVFIFVVIIFLLFATWIIATTYGVNKQGLGYSLDFSTFEASVRLGNFGSNAGEIEKISVPESFGPFKVVEIESTAFDKYSNLKEIDIPKTVKKIDDAAFSSIYNLRKINVDDANTAYSDMDGILYDKAKTKIIFLPPRTTAESLYVSANMTNISEEIFENMDENMAIRYDGTIKEWSQIGNCMMAPGEIICTDGSTRVRKIIYHYNITPGPSRIKETSYLEGLGCVLPSLSEMQMDNFVFYGWYLNDEKVVKVPNDYTGNISVEGRYVASTYNFESIQRGISSGAKKWEDNYIYDYINIPVELADLIASGNVIIKITGTVTLKVKTQGDATVSGTAWAVIAPGVLGAGYLTSDKCSASIKGGGYNWYDFANKNPKWGDEKSDKVDFSFEQTINSYTNSIPVYVYSTFSNTKENSAVQTEIIRYLSALSYTFEYRQ